MYLRHGSFRSPGEDKSALTDDVRRIVDAGRVPRRCRRLQSPVQPRHHVVESVSIHQPSRRDPSLCEHTAGMAAPLEHSSHTESYTQTLP